MDKEKIMRRIAELETLNDQLAAELRYLDNILRQAGFSDGLITLKSATLELIEEDRQTGGI